MAHTHNDEKLAKKIEVISKEIRTAETFKIQSETQLGSMREQYKKVEGEIENMGIDPKKAQESLDEMDAEIESLLGDIQKLLPEQTV